MKIKIIQKAKVPFDKSSTPRSLRLEELRTGKNQKFNLENYEKVYKSFRWDDFKKELTLFRNDRINAAYNAIDRHVESARKNKVALYFEAEDGTKQKFTFFDLSLLSNKMANLLRQKGIAKGDRVFIFLPRVPSLYISFLGILKIGAIAGTLFSAFQEQALFDRLANSGAKIVITNTLLGERVEKIKHKLPRLQEIIYVDSESYQKKLAEVSDTAHIAQMHANDAAFMLYTSGTTGKPKGVVHRHLAILQEHLTARWVLDIRDEDIYWCTADPGWVTGIAYEILGSWSNGASTVVFEGRFDPARWYKILQDYKVTVWYTAPTAVRMLMAAGGALVKKYDLANLRHLASVGEPLNPEAIFWGRRVFGLSFHDNWWQTETGAIMIANYPCLPIKPGSMGKPFPGVIAAIVDDNGNKLGINKEGNLALKPGWPSMMKTIWRRPHKYRSYFLKGLAASHERAKRVEWYISGDRAYQDKDGYFWFIGRADDVIKTSGERVGPFEVESALVAHPTVVEAGVIGKPDAVRGEIIKAFVVLKKDVKTSEKLKAELSEFVKKHLAGHAYPREIEFIDKLPKTRSGKIMRRVLKAKEMGLPIGDTSTLEEY
ncbi:acetate--CoA ligase [Candidatus Microgenomates bacterium]|nr:acetate--CoA ligase [Candidatus Microgenomates bacterium]MBI2622156.1 acetate--CoA ligase [Candidatus Microgenomates bacterium]